MDTKKLRQKILDLAIRGKLVPQDPNDEPASLLLERIRAEKERLIKEGKIKRNKKTAENDDIEAPFEIPESWEWTTIDEICFLIFAGGDKPKVLSTSPTEKCCFPVFANAVQNEGLYGYTNNPAVTNKAITISARGTIGFVCKRMSPFTPIVRLITVIPPESIIDYLTYTLCCLTKPTEGSSIPQLTVPTFKKNIIPLPPLAEQERIVDEVERWFTLIDELESNEDDLLKAIDKAKSKILDLAIHGKLVPQDPNDEPAIELLKRINPKFEPCDDERYEDNQIPEKWSFCHIGDIANIIGGVSYKKDDIQTNGIRILRGGNIQDGKIVFAVDDVFVKDTYYNVDNKVRKGDIVVVASTGSSILIGKTGFATIDIPDTQIGAFLKLVRPNRQVLPNYLDAIFLSDYYKTYIRKIAKGSNINNIKNSHLSEFVIALPPYQEQLRIVSKIEEVFKALDALS